MSLDDAWRAEAVCQSVDPVLFDAENSRDSRLARKICDTCPVIKECLLDCLTTEPRDGSKSLCGVRGGMNAKARGALKIVEREALIFELTRSIRQGARP